MLMVSNLGLMVLNQVSTQIHWFISKFPSLHGALNRVVLPIFRYTLKRIDDAGNS